MGTCAKYLFWSTLGFALVLSLAVISLPWWGAVAFQRWIPVVLEDNGFSEVEVALEQLGLSGAAIRVGRMRYQGVAIRDSEIVLQYDLKDLLRGQVKQVVFNHPVIEMDLSEGLPSRHDPEAEENRELPERSLPIEALEVVDAVITLRREDWSRTWELDAQFTAAERVQGNISVHGEGIRLKAKVNASLPHRSGRIDASATIEEPANWLNFAAERGWLSLPEKHSLRSNSLDVEVSAEFEHLKLKGWESAWSIGQIDGSMRQAGLSARTLEVWMRGDGKNMNRFDAQIDDGRAKFEALTLDFDRFRVAGTGPDQIEMDLAKWELKGELPLDPPGSVGLRAGDVKLVVEGNWQAWEPDFSVEQLGLNLHLAKSPLNLFTGMGSARGTFLMDGGLSADVPRRLTLSAELLDAELTGSGVGLESEHLKASLQGLLPDELGATFGLSGGALSWSKGAGLLKGLNGEMQLSDLQPLATKGSQELRFVSIEQGDFTTGSGRLRFSYRGGLKPENPLKLEFSADALGGQVRVVAKGRAGAPRSLALRVTMEQVDLAKVAALFPQFDGQIEGSASGEMALRLEDQRLVLQPGSLQLVPDTVGRFAYTQQGWLTQDPDLDPEAFVKDRDILRIMEAPHGASVITELAMRDLVMTEFTLKVLERDSDDERVMVRIKGNSTVKGIEVPVVLDVPISGDVKETINAVLKLNTKR